MDRLREQSPLPLVYVSAFEGGPPGLFSEWIQVQEEPTMVNLRFWERRLTSPSLVDDDFYEGLYLANQNSDDNYMKSRTCSPAPPVVCDVSDGDSDKENLKDESESLPLMCLDASALGDIPARYVIPSLPNYEFPVVGVYIDPRVVPGFKYKVRALPEPENPKKISYLFNGRALKLLSIGRGYARRLTFEPDNHSTLNSNDNYFWTDSRNEGFGFEIQVLNPYDKFTIHDPSKLIAGTLEIIDTQGPQEEVSHTVLKDRSIEKRVKVKAMCKIEWFDDSGTTVLLPMSGLAVAVKKKENEAAVVMRVVSVTIGRHNHKRGFTLTQGVKTNWRRTVVSGSSIGDIPAKYTVTGLHAYELPVIGTYVDPRIIPGFKYKVRPAESKKTLFNGKALDLVSVGMGYGKRLTFESDSNNLNFSQNHFWSDSIPEGYGFEPVAVGAGQRFIIKNDDQSIGHAQIFRVDAPQKEIRQEIEKTESGPVVTKFIEVDVTCHVTLTSKNMQDKVMRVTGIAVVQKNPASRFAKLIQIQNIGLDSQINLLFIHEDRKLVFLPE